MTDHDPIDIASGPLDLVIFDCDGVLIDSEVLASRIDALALVEIGIPITTEEVLERYVGISTATMLADIAARHGTALPEGFAEELQRRALDAFETELAAIPGVAAAIDALPHRICVASSSAPARLRRSLKVTGLFPRFDPHIFSAAQVARGKPAPDLFLFAAERMEIPPARCLVIEDSIAGVRAARAAGMTVLGFTGGAHCRPGHGARLEKEGAVATFAEMARLPALLGL